MEDKDHRLHKHRGHKNTKTSKKKNITWEAQLNIKADNLATRAQIKLQKAKNAKHTFYPLPAARIYLTLNKSIILSRHKEAIIEAWCYKDYEKHLKQKYQWNIAEITDICSHTPSAIFKNA
eukprot:9853711-Ditylum_brightwellii.AAC.1